MNQASPPAMFSRTGAADFPTNLKCMISGPPKSGKTRFLGTVPNVLVLDTEPHANNLQSLAGLDIPFKTINSTNDLRQAQFILSQEQFRKQAAQGLGMPDIEAVAIDTLDTLQSIMKRERMVEQKSSKFLRDDWGWLKEEMASIIDSFTSLPMHVFFIVHTKTKDIGTEDNPKTIILPGLEGSISESIAGMVGYSFLSFRKEEVDVSAPNGRRTSYFLQTEGDETYEFLGNRADGRLPTIIRPDFKTVWDSVMANRPTAQHQPVAVDLSLQTTGQTPQPAQSAPAAQPAAPAAQAPAPAAQPTPQPEAQPAAPAAPSSEVPAQNAGQAPAQSGQPSGTPAPNDNDDPISQAAKQFVAKVYAEIQVPMPEAKVDKLTMGEARTLVRAFKAIQQDAAEGKGGTPAEVMSMHLQAQGLMPDEGEQAAPEKPAVEAKVDGNIEEVKAYVGDDLARAQEAYDLEHAKGDSARTSLISWLDSKGAKPPVAPPAQQVQTPVQSDPTPPTPADQGVTPEAPQADGETTEEQGLQNAEQGLGGTVIETKIEGKCVECGNPIDDEDLAELGLKRYQKLLCVKDYLAEGKKVTA